MACINYQWLTGGSASTTFKKIFYKIYLKETAENVVPTNENSDQIPNVAAMSATANNSGTENVDHIENSRECYSNSVYDDDNSGLPHKAIMLTGNCEISVNSGNAKVLPAFEEVLDSIGSRGKFQAKLNVVFNFVGPCINLISVYVFYLAMQTPDHWCHVPGRENTNMSLTEWKNFTIPREEDSFSKCQMYNQSDDIHSSSKNPVQCQHGWDYDDTWFSLTVPSQMNWVCDNRHIINDVLFYAQNIGVALGLLFGYIGDMYGRRPQQFLCVAAHVISRLLLVLTPDVLPLFILAQSLISGAAGPMIESALSVGLELTDIRHRTTLNYFSSSSLGLGIMASAFLAWPLRNWNYFVSCSAAFCLALFLFFRWFPESPRWLACRGREEDALRLLRRIATTNGGQLPPYARQVMRNVGTAQRDRKGFLSLFSSWNVFKNSVLLIMARSTHLLTLQSIVMMSGGVGVNPFLSVAAQGAIQLPAYCVVHYTAARFGRRWSAVGSALLSGIAAAAVSFMLTANVSGLAITVMMVITQFFTTGTNGMANLQSVELHPTCLRQIAACVEWTAAGVVMSALPYVALMSDRRMPCAILAALNLGTAFAVSFLPESALQRLPETLQDAAVFGKGQKYWSWKPKPPRDYVLEKTNVESSI
ncbi:solute carrier family 22 member 7-like [Schistocerca nitens]|uniref:solute carrier family 22 member 7-like n=1 Tax=Schistocerca nitens TaxID=7011 RepID=UPI0021197A56|nr:solute carrier family 22 member 7-like [Schistocerca nitens]